MFTNASPSPRTSSLRSLLVLLGNPRNVVVSILVATTNLLNDTHDKAQHVVAAVSVAHFGISAGLDDIGSSSRNDIAHGDIIASRREDIEACFEAALAVHECILVITVTGRDGSGVVTASGNGVLKGVVAILSSVVAVPVESAVVVLGLDGDEGL